MAVPVRRAGFAALSSDHLALDGHDARALGVLDAGERICPPAERSGSMLGATLLMLVLAGGAWGLLSTQAEWLAWVGARVAALSPSLREAVAPAAPSPAALEPIAPAAAPLPASTPPVAEPQAAVEPAPASAPAVVKPPAEAPVDNAEMASDAEPEAMGPTEPSPLPPPQVDPADPYQRRAAAVGLHPALSRVLLGRLSAADYRNAGYAVDTAVAKIADEGEFIWPRQRRPEQALFRVHFVAGAAPQCRRYVVTVVKDGWTTTAPPMERCGSAAGKAGTARAAAEADPKRSLLKAR